MGHFTGTAPTCADEAPTPGTPAVGVLTRRPGTDVYQPQEDSHLLRDELRDHDVSGVRVADLCTGSGILALEAALLGARSVLAVDSCPAAVTAAATLCLDAPCPVQVELDDVTALTGYGLFDFLTCNPPYVPTPADPAEVRAAGPSHAWDAGTDGRDVIDRLCATAPALLSPGGTMLLVQSEFTGVTATLDALRRAGLSAEVARTRYIPFGPVLTSRATWLETTGLLESGRRVEELVVIRADKPGTGIRR